MATRKTVRRRCAAHYELVDWLSELQKRLPDVGALGRFAVNKTLRDGSKVSFSVVARSNR